MIYSAQNWLETKRHGILANSANLMRVGSFVMVRLTAQDTADYDSKFAPTRGRGLLWNVFQIIQVSAKERQLTRDQFELPS